MSTSQAILVSPGAPSGELLSSEALAVCALAFIIIKVRTRITRAVLQNALFESWFLLKSFDQRSEDFHDLHKFYNEMR